MHWKLSKSLNQKIKVKFKRWGCNCAKLLLGHIHIKVSLTLSTKVLQKSFQPVKRSKFTESLEHENGIRVTHHGAGCVDHNLNCLYTKYQMPSYYTFQPIHCPQKSYKKVFGL